MIGMIVIRTGCDDDICLPLSNLADDLFANFLGPMLVCKMVPSPRWIPLTGFCERRASAATGEFVEVSEQAGGTKCMECRIYLSALNHADTDTILQAIDQAPWRD